jgi:two-component system sensor histidine kinase ChvG
MKSNFFRSSSILRKFLVFNLVIFLVLGVFTFLYLNATKPNLIKKRSNHHARIIDNTSDHIKRLNVKFNEESSTKFLLKNRFLFQNSDRTTEHDLNFEIKTYFLIKILCYFLH